MSDIKVTISGDGAGAQSAFHGVSESVSEFSDKLEKSLTSANLTAKGIEKAAEMVKEMATEIVEFGKSSVEAYFKIEKANMQLERAAGENTKAFQDQARAMSEHLGISNTTIETMEKMLVTYGEAPSEIGKTVQALLDYSAYSGVDAVSATHTLTASITGGRTAFKELGLEYEHSGEKTKVLTSLTDALARKVGGTAEEESNTLEGTMKKAANQTELLKQGIGELIATFISDTGVVGTFTSAIKDLQAVLRVSTGHGSGVTEIGYELQQASEKLASMQSSWASAKTFFTAGMLGPTKEEIDEQIAEVDRLKAALINAGMGELNKGINKTTGPSDEGYKESQVGKKAKDKEKEEAKKDLEFFKAIHNQKKLEDDHFEELQEESKLKATDKIIRDMQEGQKKEMAEQDKEQEEWVHVLEKDAKMFEKFNENVMRQNDKFKADMAKAGADIANALLGTMMNAIEASMDGGDFDVVSAISDLGFSILSTLTGLIPGVGGFVSQAVNMAGKIVHHETAAAFKRSEAAAGKHHDGGWIEPERFHSGGWPGVGSDESMALLQSGERVLSRSEVGRMGGARGVDSMAQGRSSGGMTVNVSALDARSFMEYMGDRGGRSFYNAIRSGHGTLSSVFR